MPLTEQVYYTATFLSRTKWKSVMKISQSGNAVYYEQRQVFSIVDPTFIIAAFAAISHIAATDFPVEDSGRNLIGRIRFGPNAGLRQHLGAGRCGRKTDPVSASFIIGHVHRLWSLGVGEESGPSYGRTRAQAPAGSDPDPSEIRKNAMLKGIKFLEAAQP